MRMITNTIIVHRKEDSNQEFPKVLLSLRRSRKKVQNNQAEIEESENWNSEWAQQIKKKSRANRAGQT